GERLAALAAADYFFDTPLKRAYFENFTNLIPMERSGSVRASLRKAVEALRGGLYLLIFPEGTRSRDGVMAAFKPTAGYLALHCGVDVLPVHIAGTHQALPPGSVVPRKAKLRVTIGRPIPFEELRRRTEGLAKGEAHKVATRMMEEEVRRLGGVAGTSTATSSRTPSLSPSANPSSTAPSSTPFSTPTHSPSSTPSPVPSPARAPAANAPPPPHALRAKGPK
ncbi:MAG TPA: lysophospholipid acyltransferase family protein, partial [Anaeromyxobacteraceae bacterium]|nr:lysophospholipid acyltransferase family protein [Anaeromyxobacteraceae bacterium]